MCDRVAWIRSDFISGCVKMRVWSGAAREDMRSQIRVNRTRHFYSEMDKQYQGRHSSSIFHCRPKPLHKESVIHMY